MSLTQDYVPGAYPVYLKQIKYPSEPSSGRSNSEPLSLVYASDSFVKNDLNIISAVLIYKINFDSLRASLQNS